MCNASGISSITDPIKDLGNSIIDVTTNISTGGAFGFKDNKVSRGTAADVYDKAARETGNAIGEVTGAKAYERSMKALSDRQEAESNRLLWERDNNLALSKENDIQAEARKRMRASQQEGRTGTILTGFDSGTSTQLGAGGGTTLLGA